MFITGEQVPKNDIYKKRISHGKKGFSFVLKIGFPHLYPLKKTLGVFYLQSEDIWGKIYKTLRLSKKNEVA